MIAHVKLKEWPWYHALLGKYLSFTTKFIDSSLERHAPPPTGWTNSMFPAPSRFLAAEQPKAGGSGQFPNIQNIGELIYRWEHLNLLEWHVHHAMYVDDQATLI